MTIKADSVSYHIGRSALVDDVSIHVEEGEILAVLGPNGAGKSTLMKLLSGEISPSSGKVMLNGIELQNINRQALAKQRAVLPQQSDLMFPLHVIEVVEMGRFPHVSRDRESEEKILWEVMDLADISHLAHRKYPGLSGGERQRVHLARVLAQIWEDKIDTPRFLMLDEPTSALDLAHQHLVLSVAKRLAKEKGVGVLAILHDINLANSYADHIVLLKNGTIAGQGRTNEILQKELIEFVFDVPVVHVQHPTNANKTYIIAEPG